MFVLSRLPVGARLALGFLLAGLASVLASGVTGLLPTRTISQEGAFQAQSRAANAELTTALAVLQAEGTRFHTTLEDAVESQPRSTLLGDQDTIQSLATQYESELVQFLHGHLLAQHPEEAQWLPTPGQGEAVVQQRALVASTINTWQRYRAAQIPVLQDILAGDVSAAETLTYTHVDVLEADTFSALYSLIQFENQLVSSEQSAALSQQIYAQGMITVLASSIALLLILCFGLLSIRSVSRPLNRLRRVMRAVASGEIDTRAEVVGRDSIAAVSVGINDLLMINDRLLAEINRQGQALAKRSIPDLYDLAQQLDNFSQQIHLQAEENAALASKAPSAAMEERVQRLPHIAQEISTIARRLEAIPGEAMNASTKAGGSDAGEMPVF